MKCDLKTTIYHRILPGIKDRLVDLYEQGDGIARWMPSQVHLQRGDVFPALAAGQSVNFWITFHADSNTRPGMHRGLIQIAPAGQPATKLPLEIRVRDFQLQRPRAAFGMFFREDMLPRRFGGLDTPHKLVQAMYRDMAEHGHNAGWFYPAATFANLPPTNSPALEKLLPLAHAAGLLDPAIPSMICGGIPGDLDAPQLLAAGRWLNRERQEQGWPELVVFGTDEPAYPRDAAVVRKQLRQLRGLPLRVNVDLDATAAYGYGDLCDILTVMDGQLSAEMQHEARRRGTIIWTYSYRIWRKDLSPLRQRYYAGLYTWTHRLGGNWVWAYHHAHHRHAWFAPADPRPHPVTGYEARREGIDDYRYLQMLEDTIAQNADQPEARAAAVWLTSLRQRLISTLPHQVEAGRPLAIEEFDQIRSRAAHYVHTLDVPARGAIESTSRPPQAHARDEAAPYRGKSVAHCITGLEAANLEQRRAAAWALFEWGPQAAAATESLAHALEDPDLRVPALRALEAIGPAAAPAIPSIAALLKHPDFYLRIGAILSLGEIGCPLHPRTRSGLRAPSPAASQVVRPLVSALFDERASLVHMAAELLAALGPRSQIAVPRAITLLRDMDPTRRAAGLGLVTDLGPLAYAAVPALLELRDSWGASHLRALAAIGPPAHGAIDALEQYAQLHNGSDRIEALHALCWVRGAETDLGALLELLNPSRSNNTTRQQVLVCLNQLGVRASAGAKSVRSMLAAGQFPGQEDQARAFLQAVDQKSVPGIRYHW
ncbi:MAG: HEAT repeat domain-containing protein [Planctomycetota bacterium]|nr:HEAT repeat domain-containing protein [Planctomycetota bacterium]